MFFKKKIVQFIILFALFTSVRSNYQVPEAQFEILHPKGFSVSIPDEEGIELFAFHGKLNEEMEGREGGFYSRDITKAKNGRWTFTDKLTKLKPNDVIYYWTLVQYNNGQNSLYYHNDDKMWVVPDTTNNRVGTTESSSTNSPTSTPSNCKLSETTVQGRAVCQGQLIFEDNFNSIDSSKWEIANKFVSKPNYEFVVYMNNPENIRTNGGILKITPTLLENRYGENFRELDLYSACTGKRGTTDCYRQTKAFFILPPVISGQLTTKNKFSFKYGKVEIRAKLPLGAWIYPDLILEPKDDVYGDNYESGSMRVAFKYGNSPYNRELTGGLVLGPNDKAKSYFLMKYISQTDWSNDFHNYGLEWRPDGVIMSVDNEVYSVIKPPSNGFVSLKDVIEQPSAEKWASGTKMAPFDREFFLLLGLGVGGFNFPDSMPNKPWQNVSPKAMFDFKNNKNEWYSSWRVQNPSLNIDHVKVWAL